MLDISSFSFHSRTSRHVKMYARLLTIGALLVASLAYFLYSGNPPPRPPYIQGRNKTVLFLANSENGLSNVHVATASALLENFPDIEIHYGSFPKARSKLARVSSFARNRQPDAKDVIFHELSGPGYLVANLQLGETIDTTMAPPGFAGVSQFTRQIQNWISPWDVEEHLALYKQMGAIIDKVDPAVVVLDTLFGPAIDSTRDKNRQHAFVTPNTLVDNFLAEQPYGSMFWKYPAMTSGFAFPIPLREIPENIYLNIRFIYSLIMMPALSAKKVALRERGLADPLNFLSLHRSDVPWITMNTEGAAIPVDVIPANVTCAGPIVLSSAPAAEQDAEMAAWVKRAPTVLINLGSMMEYNEVRAAIMSNAIADILSKTNVQVIWKFMKSGEYPDGDILLPLKPYISNGRMKLSKWLAVDPTALLETGDIVVSVHHGGSNCYHEGVLSGVPQVILPLWADLYNFAALTETMGVGVWGCRATSPVWTAECLSAAILQVIDGGEKATALREKAKQIGQAAQSREKGRDIAAREVAKLAYVK